MAYYIYALSHCIALRAKYVERRGDKVRTIIEFRDVVVGETFRSVGSTWSRKLQNSQINDPTFDYTAVVIISRLLCHLNDVRRERRASQ